MGPLIADALPDTQSAHPVYGVGGLNRTETLGMHLRHRPVFRSVRRHRPAALLDLGCGHMADLLVALAPEVPLRVGVDMEIDRERAAEHGITAIDGEIVETLAALEPGSFDYVTMLSVLEHLPNPQDALEGIHRVLAPGGVAFVHVPTWMGKPVLEVMGFRQGVSADGIDDHRTYYRISQLWPMVIQAGFRPKYTRMRYGLGGMVLDATMSKPPS